MKFKLEFDCDNAAFGEDEDERREEIAAILRKLGTQLQAATWRSDGAVSDTNGNTIGRWSLS